VGDDLGADLAAGGIRDGVTGGTGGRWIGREGWLALVL